MGEVSKRVIKFIFISASFSRLEQDKWRRYIKGNLPRGKVKEKKKTLRRGSEIAIEIRVHLYRTVVIIILDF